LDRSIVFLLVTRQPEHDAQAATDEELVRHGNSFMSDFLDGLLSDTEQSHQKSGISRKGE
jgi:hypothetical protein